MVVKAIGHQRPQASAYIDLLHGAAVLLDLLAIGLGQKCVDARLQTSAHIVINRLFNGLRGGSKGSEVLEGGDEIKPSACQVSREASQQHRRRQ